MSIMITFTDGTSKYYRGVVWINTSASLELTAIHFDEFEKDEVFIANDCISKLVFL